MKVHCNRGGLSTIQWDVLHVIKYIQGHIKPTIQYTTLELARSYHASTLT